MFLITAGMLIVCGILYILFADSSLQPWNFADQGDAIDERELVSLKLDVEQAMLAKEKEAADGGQEAVTAEVTDDRYGEDDYPNSTVLAR